MKASGSVLQKEFSL